MEGELRIDQAETKSGFLFKQVLYGTVSLGGIAYLATSVGANKPNTDQEKRDRNLIVLGCAAFGGLTGLVIGLASKKVEKK